jgi:hypothetical protein
VAAWPSARGSARVGIVVHEVDVQVAVAGMAEHDDRQAACAAAPQPATRSGMRDTGTTTSSLILPGLIVRSAGESARRAAHSRSRALPSAATSSASIPSPSAAGQRLQRVGQGVLVAVGSTSSIAPPGHVAAVAADQRDGVGIHEFEHGRHRRPP